MADYIYLLQNRLSAAQQAALQSIRDVAKAHGLTVFLVGGAVRDLTSGSPVRDLDVVVQGDALKLKKEIESTGAELTGEVPSWHAFFADFPGGVRVEISSTLSIAYPKPGKPVAQPATILDDLRRRDFTVNAMALSLNEGSYGLLMDPLNGVADIENRQLRLVSNYGFIEDPVRMIRAARFAARLGWTMDEKTQARYDTGKTEKYIGALSSALRGYETEQIFHEEDPLRVLRKLEEEGWMKHLFPAITVAKASAAELERLREVQTQLQVSGINPDPAAAHFPLLTAKLSASEVAELKKSFVRQGFVREIESLEAEAKEFATQLAGKGAALPSQAWKLIHAAKPEAVLWAAYSSKSPAVQAKLKSFHTEWPKARQKMPFALMGEMRIVPELDSFNDVLEKVFFELMDGNLTTPEELKAFLEPFSPPAPPPPVRIGRSRAGKKDSKASKGKKKLAGPVDEDEDDDLDRDSDRNLDHDLDQDEESGEPASLPDDENEGMEPAIAVMDEAVDQPAPEASTEPEPVLEPTPAAMTLPKATTPKPKRVRPTPGKVEAPAPAQPVVQDQVIVPPGPTHVETKATAPAKKSASRQEKSIPAKAPAQAKPTVPAEASKVVAVAAKAPAKKIAVPTSAKASKSVPSLPPVKQASSKQVTVPAKKTASIATTFSAAESARKSPSATAKKAAKTKR